jgi:HpcH/HpaI aldolase/citrate lyase family
VLTLWTDDHELARSADAAGVDRVGLDLEILGKRERQAGLGTWISPHRGESATMIGESLSAARLFARVNPLNPRTREEVEPLVESGVAVLMLPMFRTRREVERFVEIVDGRAEIVLLLETREAVERIDEIAGVPGVDEIHVGINDLSLELGLRNRFAVYDCEQVERVSASVRQAGLRFGIGGIGLVDDTRLPVPSDLLYAQYPRLHATAALISRAFTERVGGPRELRKEVANARARLDRWFAAGDADLERAHRAFRAAVAEANTW